jgi:hypothetical protein
MAISAEQIRSEINPPWDAGATVVLSGHQEGGRYALVIEDIVVWLPPARFQAFVDLANARLMTKNAITSIPSAGAHPGSDLARLTVHRLRRDLQPSLGQKRVKDLIRRGASCAGYFLGVSETHVAVADSFFELTANDVRAEVIDGLRRLRNEALLKPA